MTSVEIKSNLIKDDHETEGSGQNVNGTGRGSEQRHLPPRTFLWTMMENIVENNTKQKGRETKSNFQKRQTPLHARAFVEHTRTIDAEPTALRAVVIRDVVIEL